MARQFVRILLAREREAACALCPQRDSNPCLRPGKGGDLGR